MFTPFEQPLTHCTHTRRSVDNFFRVNFKAHFFYFNFCFSFFSAFKMQVANVLRANDSKFSFDVMIFENSVDSLLTHNENLCNIENCKPHRDAFIISLVVKSVFDFDFSVLCVCACPLHLAQSKITRAKKHKSVEQYLPNCLHFNAKSYRFSSSSSSSSSSLDLFAAIIWTHRFCIASWACIK